MRRCVMMLGLYVGLRVFFNVHSMYIRVSICLWLCYSVWVWVWVWVYV